MLLENDDKLSSSIMETNEFALREFDHPLTMLQQKLYWMSLALIHKGENPEEPSKLYDLDINDMAKLMNTDVKSLRKNMKDAIAKFGDTSVSLRPTFKTAPKKTAYLLGIYQIIFVDQDNVSKIQTGFNYYFRKKILEMKQVHDIEYPLNIICGYHDEDIVLINAEDIFYLETIQSNVYIHTRDSVYRGNKPLGFYEEKLKPLYFFKTHKCYLANLSKVDYFSPRISYTYDIFFKGIKDVIPLSRNNVKALKNQLQ